MYIYIYIYHRLSLFNHYWKSHLPASEAPSLGLARADRAETSCFFFWPRGSFQQEFRQFCSGGGQGILQRLWVDWPLTHSVTHGGTWTQGLRHLSSRSNHRAMRATSCYMRCLLYAAFLMYYGLSCLFVICMFVVSSFGGGSDRAEIRWPWAPRQQSRRPSSCRWGTC